MTPKMWWLSFADGARPKGTQFLGAAIVPADDFASAVLITHLLSINPGGEVAGQPVPEHKATLIPERWLNRLMSREDIDAFDEEMYAIEAK